MAVFYPPPMAVTAERHDLMKSNVEIIQEILEQVVNQKKIDVYDQYFSPDYVSRGDPYIGTGLGVDSSGDEHILQFIAPGSPAEGKLQVGDELLWVEDEHRRWDTYDEIKQGFLQGSRGSQYKVGVRRGDQTLEVALAKGLIQGFDTPKDRAKSDLQEFMTKQFPDLRASIEQFLVDGDRIVCLVEYRGTHVEFEREAVWREAWFVRMSEGKIVEDWTVYDGSSYFRQLGYQLIPPGA
jgi:ketosteroid isomerase-like protein